VSGLLEGKNVNLRVRDRDDFELVAEWYNDMDFVGEYDPIREQISKAELIKMFDNPPNLVVLTEWKIFIIQKKDGTRIGTAFHCLNLPRSWMEIGYFLIPSERGKGYGTEAAQLMVDYLFLSKELGRIHAYTDVRNKTSQRVLEKAGFQREGTIRKCAFVRGEVVDCYLYGILREEWKEPKILTKTPSKSEHK
jgi:RimJ/RimL family protein N-acetyltransferase